MREEGGCSQCKEQSIAFKHYVKKFQNNTLVNYLFCQPVIGLEPYILIMPILHFCDMYLYRRGVNVKIQKEGRGSYVANFEQQSIFIL